MTWPFPRTDRRVCDDVRGQGGGRGGCEHLIDATSHAPLRPLGLPSKHRLDLLTVVFVERVRGAAWRRTTMQLREGVDESALLHTRGKKECVSRRESAVGGDRAPFTNAASPGTSQATKRGNLAILPELPIG